jgi:hypothetical protein
MGSPPLVSTTLRPTRTRQGFSVHPVSRADVGSSLSCSTLVLPEQLRVRKPRVMCMSCEVFSRKPRVLDRQRVVWQMLPTRNIVAL